MFDPGRIGRSLRAIRVRLGLRQADVARRASCSRSFVSKVERGLARSGDIRRIEMLCVALGADVDVRVRWQGEGLDRLLDEGHATIIDGFLPILRMAEWQVALEVTFNEFGDRGSIDIFAWHPSTRSLLVIEIKAVVPDAQGTLAPLDRKVRIAPKLARARGWDVATVSRLLVIGDTTTNRERVRRFDELFDAALPVRGRDVRRWLGNPEGRFRASGSCRIPPSVALGEAPPAEVESTARAGAGNLSDECAEARLAATARLCMAVDRTEGR